ncbi:foldase protein PrsA [Bacillus sp. FSL K6-3431]|uniref:foldase protein PrsA n=1 Tax=Bacillus sp. FSL K6-3431 TaxID=2921500 RepID=UPI0030FB36BA
MNKKFLLSLIAIVVIGAAVIFSTAFSKKETVAIVGSEEISKDDLYNMLVETNGAAALDSLINTKIIELEAKKEKVEVSSKEIDEELVKYTESFGGEEAFNAALEQSGITKDIIKDDLQQFVLIKKLIEPQIKITDKEMKAYFDENKTKFNQEEQIQASHILVEDEATAKKVAKQLVDGEDFAKLAKEYSKDTGSAENGGELGYFPKGKMVKEFETVAFSMEKGKISDPVKTEHGYHIIKVTDKKAAKEAKYDDHKKDIKEILFEEKMQTEYPTWLEKMRKEYKVKNSMEKAK